jgi:hypothetical protein
VSTNIAVRTHAAAGRLVKRLIDVKGGRNKQDGRNRQPCPAGVQGSILSDVHLESIDKLQLAVQDRFAER